MIKIKEIKVKNYITKSKLPDADYVINPYIGCPHKCIYCYAEFMRRFTNHDEAWGDFLDVKTNDSHVDVKKLAGSTILFGSVTDAYNPYEKKYCITQKILKDLYGCQANIEILTKSDLVVRDIDILKQIPKLRVGISINSLDDVFRKETEPFAASVEKRIETLKKLKSEGIDTYLFLSPIFPGVSNFREIVEAVMPYVNAFYFENLNLRGAYMPRVLKYIADYNPSLLPLYEEIYKKKNNQYWEDLSQEINAFCSGKNLTYKLYFYHQNIKKGGKDYA